MQHYNKIEIADIKAFEAAIGIENVFTDTEIREKYASDKTENRVFLPEIVLKPMDTEGVSKIAKICHERRIPLTTQGALTGLSGGALPVAGGVALSLEKMNKIVFFDAENLQITVEPALITETLQDFVAAQNLFFPPDPASKGWSSIGGNVATNAGGMRALKYGVTRDYVLNLEIVLPDGSVQWTGAPTLKNSTGYNLTHLIIGSEGTLAIITKIVLRLIPLPTHNLTLLARFETPEKACAVVADIFKTGITPAALEFMEADAVALALRYTGDIALPIVADAAYLLIEIDGFYADTLLQDAEKIGILLSEMGSSDVLFADDAASKNKLWYLRRNVSNAIKTLNALKMGEDVVVPRAALPELLSGVKKIAAFYHFHTACYGHAGDGNLHINIYSENMPDKAWFEAVEKGKIEILQLVKSLNGMLSAEHGIGLTQKAFMPIFFNDKHLQLLKGIKNVFDPQNILNPFKII